jgi:hypothetical protein
MVSMYKNFPVEGNKYRQNHFFVLVKIKLLVKISFLLHNTQYGLKAFGSIILSYQSFENN